MKAVTLSEKYQICIPKEIRENLRLQPGQQFVFLTLGNVIYLVPQISIQKAKGMLKGAKKRSGYRDRKDRF